MGTSWEAVLGQRALSRPGDGKNDVVEEQCSRRHELQRAGSRRTNGNTAAKGPGCLMMA